MTKHRFWTLPAYQVGTHRGGLLTSALWRFCMCVLCACRLLVRARPRRRQEEFKCRPLNNTIHDRNAASDLSAASAGPVTSPPPPRSSTRLDCSAVSIAASSFAIPEWRLRVHRRATAAAAATTGCWRRIWNPPIWRIHERSDRANGPPSEQGNTRHGSAVCRAECTWTLRDGRIENTDVGHPAQSLCQHVCS